MVTNQNLEICKLSRSSDNDLPNYNLIRTEEIRPTRAVGQNDQTHHILKTIIK